MAAVLLIILFGARAAGTTVERFSLADVASRAARIAEVRIRDCASVREPSGRIQTRYRADILANLKGSDGASIEWLSPGGTVDGETLVIPGVPRFQSNEEIILFLSEATPAGLRLPIGLGQGAFRERFDPSTRRTLVKPDLVGLELIDPATGKRVEAAASEFERAAFLAEVRALVGR